LKKKAIILTAILFMFVSSSAFALNNFYIDGCGSLITNNDARTQFGGGLGFGYNVVGNWNVLYKFQMTVASMQYKNTEKYMDYDYMSNMAGVEYLWKFGRIGWRSAILAGVSSCSVPYVSYSNNITPTDYTDDTITTKDYSGGLAFALMSGAQFDVTQHIAPFIEVGFHYDYFAKDTYQHNYTLDTNKAVPLKIYGVNLLVGVRFTIGSNQSISSDY